jgi:hypothetical protein
MNNFNSIRNDVFMRKLIVKINLAQKLFYERMSLNIMSNAFTRSILVNGAVKTT